MAKREKRVAARKAKLKRGSARTKMRKKVVKRAAPKKAKKASRPSKPSAGVAKRVRAGQRERPLKPAVEDTVIDLIDEPVPGVLRVTEIEEVSVAVPNAQEDDEEE